MKINEERTGRLSLIRAGSARPRQRPSLSVVTDAGAPRLRATAAFRARRRRLP
jgi:hypothetical protein